MNLLLACARVAIAIIGILRNLIRDTIET